MQSTGSVASPELSKPERYRYYGWEDLPDDTDAPERDWSQLNVMPEGLGAPEPAGRD